MLSVEMPLVPPVLRESVFLILEGCTWRSVQQDHGVGSGSTVKMAKKVVWRWEVTRRSACQLRAKRETLLGCKSLKALTLLKRARLKSWSIRLGLTILSNQWLWNGMDGRSLAGVQGMPSAHCGSWSVTCSPGLVIGKCHRFSPWSCWRYFKRSKSVARLRLQTVL